jgi:acyl-CoA oxidase
VLDGRYAELRDEVRDVQCRPEFAPVAGLARDEYRDKVMEWAQAIAASGLSVPGFPVEYGGRDDFGANVAAFETMGHGDLSLLVKFGVQFGLWGGAVHQLGTKRHHDQLLRGIGSLEIPGCFAMTERGHGSNVQQLETTATYDRATQEFVINTPHDEARKDYIGNAAVHGRKAAVFAQLYTPDGTCHGVHTFVVALRNNEGEVMSGVRIEDDGQKVGLNGVDNGQIWFDNVRVPREALLNRHGDVAPDGTYSSPIDNPNKRFFTMLGTLVQGRVCVSAASVSNAKNALTIAVRYGLRRRQFGPPGNGEVPLLDYRTHQRRLMPLLAKTYAQHFLQQELSERFHAVFSDPDETSDRERRELESLAAGIKAATSWHAMDTIQTCRECCGGAGYMAENRFGEMRNDVDIFTTFEGDNTVLTMLAARGLLTDYAADFGGMNPTELVVFVAGQAVETVVERLFARKIAQVISDAVPTLEPDRNLLEREHQLELFHWRQGHIVASVANRFRRGLSEGHEPFEVFRAVQNHAVDAARAYIDTRTLEAFVRAIDACEDEETKAVLNLVCDLYALQTIEAEKGFYQEHGRLSSPRTKAITREVNRLCNEVRLVAGELVDAFGIPDAVLGAPIGLSTQD